MSYLHTVSSSPQSISLQRMLATLQDGDAILLMADGVYCVDAFATCPTAIYVINEDAQSRGIDHPFTGIDYAGMVNLVVDYDKQISWG